MLPWFGSVGINTVIVIFKSDPKIQGNHANILLSYPENLNAPYSSNEIFIICQNDKCEVVNLKSISFCVFTTDG